MDGKNWGEYRMIPRGLQTRRPASRKREPRTHSVEGGLLCQLMLWMDGGDDVVAIRT